MSLFHVLAALVTLSALAGYLNYRLLRLPTSIGLMLVALVLSGALLALREAGLFHAAEAKALLTSIDFGSLVLHGMLGFLLFAGALHVDLGRLKSEAWPVGLLATLGVAVSTAVSGLLFRIAAQALGIDISLVHALLFGAVVAPTDPIAVLGILRKAGVPKDLELQITGESLFNDGVAVVVFLTLLQFAAQGPNPSAGGAALFLLQQVAGGLALGVAAGFCAYRLLHGVDEYPVEVLITLAAAMGAYSAAEAIGVSAPISVVAAGLVIGNQGRAHAMSPRTRERVDAFWELVDYVLNALLFVLLGLQLLALEAAFSAGVQAILIVASVPLALLSRLAGVSLPLALLRPVRRFRSGSLSMLTWGGLKGGVSLALALSLPAFPGRHIVLAATYAVVVFSVLAQGLTLGRLAARIAKG
ncbi:MAG TPA: sodium:proton antiporter [Burkholderiales bacterium]|nr:sodium:proton antiporter [Burkholderiales bacterium]